MFYLFILIINKIPLLRINESNDNIFQIPKSYSLQAAGPIFCSGITMYTPLKQWGALKGGMNVGVVGIGGLGQVLFPISTV